MDLPALTRLDAINRVRADPADLTISAVSLIEMHRDNRMYEWRTVELYRSVSPPDRGL